MGVVNFEQVKRSLRKVAQELPAARVGPVARAAMFRALDALIATTPVDTGRLRGGWDATTGAPSGWAPSEGEIRAPEAVQSKALEVFSVAPVFGTFWLTNNVDYAWVWEYGAFKPPDPGPTKHPLKKGQVLVQGGFNTQAPQGMLRAGRAAMLDVLRRARGFVA